MCAACICWIVENVFNVLTFFFLLFFSVLILYFFFFFFSSRRRHTRFDCDWSSDVCSSDLQQHRSDCSTTSRSLGAADVTSWSSSRFDAAATSSTARANASSFACDGLLKIGRASCRERV